MKTVIPYLVVAGAIQWLIASANLVIPRKLRYAENLERLTPIVRQVFVVHAIYIVGVLLFFGAMSMVFATDLAGGSALGRCVSAFLAAFWLARVGVQLFYYDAATKRANRIAHAAFTAMFAYLGVVFAVAALGGAR
ncbi:MAG TPA: hypothetical protein VLZ12_01360 [Verrucomicrobiae bacterium]|nr:hypothetical protein [Verrucomicrobiae bacterium]